MSCIILVGMPGAGKSTVGVILAKLMAMDFVDTDLLIQQQTGKHLQAIVDEQGYQALRDIEAQVLVNLQLQHCVIATGGSAVYSPRAMGHLQDLGPVVYLAVPLVELQKRLQNIDERGLACAAGTSLPDLYRERVPLYEKYADYVIENLQGDTAEVIATNIQQSLAV